VLIADDHEMTRKGIRDFLNLAPDIQVIGEAQSEEEIKQFIVHHYPQILLLDLVMPNFSPFELEKWVRTNYPETITLILTAHDRDSYLSKMIEAGAVGYLDKKLRAGQLIDAIRRAVCGESLFDKGQLERGRQWREKISSKWESLSDREREVLQKLTEGLSNYAIAKALGIKTNTVEKHLENVYKKLEVTSRAEATHWWLENNT
jgi:DNA-binding NarL/FixJ family response regulator